jgi:hypothetical protein
MAPNVASAPLEAIVKSAEEPLPLSSSKLLSASEYNFLLLVNPSKVTLLSIASPVAEPVPPMSTGTGTVGTVTPPPVVPLMA